MNCSNADHFKNSTNLHSNEYFLWQKEKKSKMQRKRVNWSNSSALLCLSLTYPIYPFPPRLLSEFFLLSQVLPSPYPSFILQLPIYIPLYTSPLFYTPCYLSSYWLPPPSANIILGPLYSPVPHRYSVTFPITHTLSPYTCFSSTLNPMSSHGS